MTSVLFVAIGLPNKHLEQGTSRNARNRHLQVMIRGSYKQFEISLSRMVKRVRSLTINIDQTLTKDFDHLVMSSLDLCMRFVLRLILFKLVVVSRTLHFENATFIL